MADRELLEAFLNAIDGSPSTLRRPVCRGWMGDYQISGKNGHVLTDGTGYYLYVAMVTPKQWTYAKKRLAWAELTQDGDDEGIFRLSRLPTGGEGQTIRDVIRIRRRTHLSDEEIVRRRSQLQP